MKGLLKYNYKVYVRNNKFIIPLIAFCLFEAIYYSQGKEKFAAAVIFGANATFCVMIWMGFLFTELQDARTEEILFLKVNNSRVYWLSKVVFMIFISFLVALLGTIWPSIKATEGQCVKSIIFGFVLQFLSAVMGIMLGMIFQKKITGNKNRSILLLFFCALLTMIKVPVLKEFMFLKYIMWILPPMSNFTFSDIANGVFSTELLLKPIVFCLIYIVFETLVYLKLMMKKLF